MRTADQRRDACLRGIEAEQFVAEDYQSAGWTVLGRNVRGGGAELDLVVERGGEVRFVEVKLRPESDRVGIECITADKRRRLVRGARAFLSHYTGRVEGTGFDVVLVKPGTDEGWTLDRWPNAFDA